MARLALAVLLCCALLPRAAHAQMTWHVLGDFETLQTDVNSTEELLYQPGVTPESAKFQEYRDLSSGFRLRELRLFGDDPAKGSYVDLHGTNVGRTDGRLGLDWGTWGGWGIDLDYNRIKHDFGNDGTFLWNITGPGHFDIPDSTQLAVQHQIEQQFALNPSGITYDFLRGLLNPYLAAANRIDVGLQRNRTDVTMELGKMADLGWALQIQHEDRTGTRQYGGSFGFSNAPEIVEPIDYHTDNAELRGEWKTQNAGAQFGARYSRFQNDISTLYWDNPFRGTDCTDSGAYSAPGSGSICGAKTGFADLAPDNHDAMAFANGRLKFAGSWYATGRASYQQLRQDDALLPYTLNSAIVGIDGSRTFDPTDPANLPVRNADEKVNITDLDANVGTHFGDRFDLNFRYKYYDYDNRSPRVDFPGYVRFHAVWEAIERLTAPQSYKKQNASAEFGWNITNGTNLSVALEQRATDRDFAEVSKNRENALVLSGVSTAIENLALRGSYEHGNRNISGGYDTDRGGGATFPEPESTNLPGMRKFNQAERNYNQWNLQADYTLGDSWTLTGTTQGRKDDYDKSDFGLTQAKLATLEPERGDFGLTQAKLATLGLELGWEMSASSTLYAFVNHDDIEYDVSSRQSGSTPSTDPLANWSGDFGDKTDTLGVGWTCTQCGAWHAEVTGRYSKTNGNADLSSPPGGSPDRGFPIGNYDDVRLYALDSQVDYKLMEHAEVGLSWLYENYTINSFKTAGVTPFLPGAPLLDLANGNYSANVFGAHLKVAF